MTTRLALLVAGVLGLTAVLAGTFAAHGLAGRLDAGLLATWEVGARYHLFHAVALLALAGSLDRLGRPGRLAAWCWAFGCVVFAGSLYLLALTGQRWLGAITPIGGAGFLLGWLCVIVGAWRGAAITSRAA